jgi:pimeloyl-ACP methyl ester carboxylesterase
MIDHLTTSDGRRLAYRRSGSGSILVCHPGGPGASGHYFGSLGGLDSDHTLVALDPRATGGSDAPADDDAYRLEDYARDVDELREHLGLERLALLGHSHGGFVAMTYASEWPERVERLVIACSLARFSGEQRAEKNRLLAARGSDPDFADAVEARRARDAGAYEGERELQRLLGREFPLYFSRFGPAEQAFVDSALRAVPFAIQALRAFNATIAPTFDLREQLARITASTLVLTGDEDYMAGPLAAAEIASGIVDSRVVVVPGAGHFPWVEEPERVRSAIADFLSGTT